jgi:hypothetical protein
VPKAAEPDLRDADIEDLWGKLTFVNAPDRCRFPPRCTPPQTSAADANSRRLGSPFTPPVFLAAPSAIMIVGVFVFVEVF